MKRIIAMFLMMVFLLNCGVAIADDDYNCIPFHALRRNVYLYTVWEKFDSQYCEKREYYEYVCHHCQEVMKGYEPLEMVEHILVLYEPHCEHITGTELHYFIYVCQRCPYYETITLTCPGNGHCITVMSVNPEHETE